MKQVWPAPERNKAPILRVLRRVLPERGSMLEIASGSGQHAAHFAARLPGWQIQPSDLDTDNLNSIRGWVTDAGLPNLLEPLTIDVREDWVVARFDAIFCANMIHIAPWPCALGLLAGAGRHLKEDGVLVLYGPFKIGDEHTAPSNASFDMGLRSRDPEWGVRNLDTVIDIALTHGLDFVERVAMPANNFSVVFRKKSTVA